jgi:hypothetical protein
MIPPRILKKKDRESYLKGKMIEPGFIISKDSTSLPQTPNKIAPKMNFFSTTNQAFMKVSSL